VRRVLVAMLLLLAALPIVCPRELGANPLLAEDRRAPEPAGSSLVAPAFLQPVFRATAEFQRESQRLIGEHLERIRTGGMGAPLLVAMLLGLAYGVLHSLGPGHGKAIVASYFLAREARPWRGVLTGLQVALVHVGSAVAIVLAADLLLTRTLGAPGEVRAVRLVSHGLVLAVGLWLLARVGWRLRQALVAPGIRRHVGCGHAHGGETGVLALGVGLVPCTGSLLVLLIAMANGILTAGLLIVLAIALGMAATMAGIGFASVLARRHVAARLERGSGMGSLAIEGGGALIVSAVGLIMLMNA
jgi:ABC-type nickel/cobalt efflux system permease component RcnA